MDDKARINYGQKSANVMDTFTIRLMLPYFGSGPFSTIFKMRTKVGAFFLSFKIWSFQLLNLFFYEKINQSKY